MRIRKRVWYSLLSLCLFFLASFPASAKEPEYTYTIRFFAGKQGAFEGSEVMVFEGLHYGDRVNFYQSAVTLNDNSKYYIRGIRESGKDNSDSTQTSSFLVTGDRDYVVAYGILGDATSYTISYEDSEGNSLAPSETYYGNVGDRPVVAYLYIEGWVPEAYNMTQTLKKDPAENRFTFIYTREESNPEEPAPLPEPAPEPPAEVPPAGGVTVIPATPVPSREPIEGVNPPGEGGTPGGENPEDAQEPQGENEIPDNETPTGNGPRELRDMDENETPLGGLFNIGSDARLLGIPVTLVIAIGIGAIGLAWFFLLAKRRKKEEKS